MDSEITNSREIITLDLCKALDAKHITMEEAAAGINISIKDMEILYRLYLNTKDCK